MKMLRLFTTLILALFFTISGNAQRLKIKEGNIAPLKDEKTINIEFTYENMKVGKYDKEDDYVSKKKDEYNKKETSRGDAWAKNWVNDRDARFEPKFKELFEKHSEMTSSKDAKYTLIFKTSFTEPGFNIGIMRKNAEINGEAWVVETANRGNIIAKVSIDKALGRTFGGYDFDTGERISEAYADAGKALGKFVK